MTKFTGKIAGFIIGYFFGAASGISGPIGAIAGMILGHIYDAGPNALNDLSSMAGLSAQRRYIIQQSYFKATFLVMGHIAKADGRVSEDEIRTARSIMRKMNLNQQQRQEAIHLFGEGKQPGFNLNYVLEELYRACGANQQMLFRMFIDIQFRAAAAEGTFGPNKQRILEKICLHFGFHYREFASFYQQHSSHDYQNGQSYTDTSGYQQQQQSQQRSQQQQKPSTPRKKTKLDQAYSTLSVSKSNSDAEVKKAYRVMMSQNHPDKLISKGLPEEMIKLANQKTTEIKQAYDTIMKSRGKK